jgi:hypothetical protein
MSKDKEKDKPFQWQKGENYGTVEVVEREITLGDVDYLVFKSGRQINKNLLDEFLVRLEDVNQPIIDASINPYEKKKTPNTFTEYPTIEDLQSKQNSDGTFTVGKAETIPHPDEVDKVQQFNKRKQSEEGPETRREPIANTNRQVIDTVKEPPKSPVYDIIAKAKKEEYELILTVKVKLPVKHFFDLLDDDFVKDNKNIILKEMINKIKREDLDSQIQANLIKIYNIQEDVQQEDTQTDS